MKRIYRIRDLQRYLFLALLFPLLPLLLEVLHPARIGVLCLFEGLLVCVTFWTLFRLRELEVGAERIRIDRGRWAQEVSHEEIHEIFLERNGLVHLRIQGRSRYIRVMPGDWNSAAPALEAFARRHAIPLTDHRPRRGVHGRGKKGFGAY